MVLYKREPRDWWVNNFGMGSLIIPSTVGIPGVNIFFSGTYQVAVVVPSSL